MKVIIKTSSNRREIEFGNNRSATLAATCYGTATWYEEISVTTNKGKVIDRVMWIPGAGYKRVNFAEGEYLK